MTDLHEDPASGRLRLDKWLWYARFFKTRSLAARMCADGGVRIGSVTVTKAHHAVKPGDVLTFAQGRHIRVIKVLALGVRRGPAPEAQALYEDLAPPTAETAMALPIPGNRPPGAGRPTKFERRATDRLRQDG
jgi:ribosome-associated heat shock protein Hsp15